MPFPERFRYETLKAPEINEAVDEGMMIVIPVGATEDHGQHLPLDVDQVIVETICERTVRDRDDVLLFPTVTHGFLPHHMTMPGGITIDGNRFVEYLTDIGVSLAHHGFEKILFVNGHGSNHHLVTHAARQIILQYPEVKAANLSWWEIDELQETLAEIGDAGPRGSGHGGELETSVYMHIHPDRVDMDKAVRDISYPESDYFYAYGLANDPEDAKTQVTMMDWWTAISDHGIKGDATVATEEKGEQLLAAAVAGLHGVLDEFESYPFQEITDHHDREVTDEEYEPFRPR